MTGSIQSGPTCGRVRQRVIICLLAALLALMDWEWMAAFPHNGEPEPFVTAVSVNGVSVKLACRGDGPATVIVIDELLVNRVIDAAAQDELARHVLLCALTVREGEGRRSPVSLSDVLLGVLIGGKVSGPYAIITYATAASIAASINGLLTKQTAGFVLIDLSEQSSSHLVMAANGNEWALPRGDIEATVLAILKLFWPPDEV